MMIHPSMHAGSVATMTSRVTRGTQLMHAFVRSLVLSCVRSARASSRVGGTRAAAARAAVRAAVRSASTPALARTVVAAGGPRDDRSARMISGDRGDRSDRSDRSSLAERSDRRNSGTGNLQASREAGPLRGYRAASVAAATTATQAVGSRGSANPAAEPAFARVSSRRGAQPATDHPVRIYSTPSRTVIVGNLAEVARLLDVSIERERARLVPQA